MYTRAEVIMMPLGLAVVLLLGLTLRRLLKDKSARVREIPLHVLGGLTLVLEIAKQLDHWLILRDWNPWFLPLHFCSYFLIWYAFALCTRGQLRQIAYACSLYGGIIMTAVLLTVPRMIVGDNCRNIFASFTAFHSYTFHMLVVAYWLWLLLLRVYQPNKNHIWQTTVIHMVMFALSMVAAFALNTNYVHVLTTTIGILERVRLSAGQAVYDVLLYLGGSALIAGVTTGIYFATNACYQRATRKNQAVK